MSKKGSFFRIYFAIFMPVKHCRYRFSPMHFTSLTLSLGQSTVGIKQGLYSLLVQPHILLLKMTSTPKPLKSRSECNISNVLRPKCLMDFVRIKSNFFLQHCTIIRRNSDCSFKFKPVALSKKPGVFPIRVSCDQL